MEVEFRNITVTITGVKDAKEAYTQLCDAFGKINCEWETDTYLAFESNAASYEAAENAGERDTSELFPES